MSETIIPDPGTLAEGETHPVAISALKWINAIPISQLALFQEAFDSTALSGDRASALCGETLNRILRGVNVGERYVLALAFTLRGLGATAE